MVCTLQLHPPTKEIEYRLSLTVAAMRGSLETGEIITMQWMHGEENISDALTKRNIAIFRKLNQIRMNRKL